MAKLIESLGATHAINLDGGGSTMMAVQSPGTSGLSVANRPCNGGERLVSQALAAFRVPGG